ncbi:MAG: DUF4160 domain-containing protein [Pyrinomonadaceae bacterium]|nr:DUF4160 domain-containing protein [Pyrinomonadaceae bacterium]
MPTVLRKNGFEFKVYTDDHEPMHVHARYQGREAVIYLGNENERVALRENRGLNRILVNRALRIAAEHQLFLIESWREIYG